jgi:hypothetical protein
MCPHLRLYYRPCCKYPIKFNPQGGTWLHVLTSWQVRSVRTSPSRLDILTVLSGCFSFLPATCKILYQHRLLLILRIQEQSERNAWHNVQNQKWKWEARKREDKERHKVSALKVPDRQSLKHSALPYITVPELNNPRVNCFRHKLILCFRMRLNLNRSKR